MRRVFILVLGFGLGAGVLAILVCRVDNITPVRTDTVYPVENLIPIRRTLPAAVPGTTLIARNFVTYEGGFLEDGSDREVFYVTAMVFYNMGKTMVEWTEVIFERDTQKLVFEATCIPPRTSVLVLEKNKTRSPFENFTACYGRQKACQSPWLRDEIRIDCPDSSSLLLTNLTDKPLEQMSILYKNFYPESELYVGGITYCFPIERLAPGESVRIFPYHYSQTGTKLLGIRI